MGAMSGTSLDGLDLALCHFNSENDKITYEIIKAKTINYDEQWKERLKNAHFLNVEDFWKLHADFGKFIGISVNNFLNEYSLKADCIASHGHTVFHQPAKQITIQIGDGASIASVSNFETICDFRSVDVALGGQGAPLVPLGERDLFKGNDAFLNLGGIANISIHKPDTIKAFDVCPFNQVLNYLSNFLGKEYDSEGLLASRGIVNEDLLQQLNAIDFYRTEGVRSLGREWVEMVFLPIVEKSNISWNDKLATCSMHFAFQIARVLNASKCKSVMITGGGTYNVDFLNKIRSKTTIEFFIPDDETIQFKEALIFAYLGYLRKVSKINVLKSVTGAARNSIGGAIYSGKII
jgi:anhydro-N-acetylmuramic acid kinase